jgi:hypothetical protein
MSVRFVLMTSSKTVGARNIRPAPVAHQDRSPSALTTA